MTRDRVYFLDGLRGIAALSVVISHILYGFFPSFYNVVQTAPEWQQAFSTSPLFALVGGSFAVHIFFVLSGFVLSASIAGRQQSLVAIIPVRVLRLAVPASFSIAVAYALYVFGLFDTSAIATTAGHNAIGTYYANIDPWRAALEFSGSYFIEGSSKLNSVLWTMRHELIGSIIIYTLYAIDNTRHRTICATIVAVVCLFVGGKWAMLIGFIAGMALHSFWALLRQTPAVIAWAALILGLYMGGFPTAAQLDNVYYGLPLAVAQHIPWKVPPADLSRTGGSILVIFAVLTLHPLQRALTTRPIAFLGRISFPLYLLHWPLLCSLFGGVFINILPSHPWLTLPAVAMMIALLLVVAWAMEVFVEQPLLVALRRLKAWLSNFGRLPPQQPSVTA